MKKLNYFLLFLSVILFSNHSKAQTKYAGFGLHYAFPMDSNAKSLFDFGIGPKGSYLISNNDETFLFGGSVELLRLFDFESESSPDSSLKHFFSYSVAGKAVFYPVKETLLLQGEGGYTFGKYTKYPFIKPSIGYQANSGWLFETGYQMNLDKQKKSSFLTIGGTHYWNLN